MVSGTFNGFFDSMPFPQRLPKVFWLSFQLPTAFLIVFGAFFSLISSATAIPAPVVKLQPNPPSANASSPDASSPDASSPGAIELDLDPAILDSSPVLQRWMDEIPDVLSTIEQDPSFRTRLRLGYSQNGSANNDGIIVGVDDIFVGTTGLTLSGDYRSEVGETSHQYGVDVRYYALPLGKSVNIAPVLGYRHVDSGRDQIDGSNVGIRLLFVPSRTGAADISLTQTWVNLGSDRHSLSRFTLSAGYALRQNLRLATDIQVQTSDRYSQTDVGVLLEWML